MSPVIAAVKDVDGMKKCFESECQTVFVLYGTICNIGDIVREIKKHGKYAMVHADFTQGLGAKEIAVDFIRENTLADGVISTKPQLVKRAKELGMYGILRAFLVDSIAMNTTKKQLELFHPDMVEIMPGIMPKILKDIRSFVSVPVIAGGLLTEKKDVMSALSAGADAISTTNRNLWKM